MLDSGSKGRLLLALLAVGTGITLLLLSVMVWWNFTLLLDGQQGDDSLGSTFLTVSKSVTDNNMGRPGETVFSPADIEALKSAPQVEDIGSLVSNRFPVYAVLNRSVGFATDLFLEAAADRFIDRKPGEWQWKPGDRLVPIIISTDFLNLYNYGFALSQGLPQLSQSSIKAIAFELKVGSAGNEMVYTAQVVGFSDRISSVLVPESFISYGNAHYAGSDNIPPSRVIVKAKDPSDKAFISYLEQHGYATNAELLRWSKLRAMIDVVAVSAGILSLLILGIGVLVFILFIELTIARAQSSIVLLYELGYSPHYLGRMLIARFVPKLGIVLVAAGLLAIFIQYASHISLRSLKLHVPMLPGWPVWLAFTISALLLLLLVRRAIYKSVHHI